MQLCGNLLQEHLQLLTLRVECTSSREVIQSYTISPLATHTRGANHAVRVTDALHEFGCSNTLPSTENDIQSHRPT